MKYRDILNFNPINEVVKFDRLEDDDYRTNLVRDFVFTKAYAEDIIPLMCANLDFTGDCAMLKGGLPKSEYFGMQVVGSYGTGKSHLMSLISLIASDSKYLQYVDDERVKPYLETIAGKYKQCSFELGNSQSLWDIVCYQIDKCLDSLGVNYSISTDNSLDAYSKKIETMMAHFEEKYPNQGFLLVIDEMLSYLKGRSEPSKLNNDLMVLQALGQVADKCKFRVMFGVQELIYKTPEFQFASEMLSHVKDRYIQCTITKEDVQYIVKLRLLKKDEHQKQAIRKYLEPFTQYFSDMHAHFEDYVDLFPVHPSYFDNFQQIKIGRSQREILKTISKKCSTIMDDEIPQGVPGLICYDDYWNTIERSADLMANPDIRRVRDIMATINDKIESNLTGAKASRKKVAHRIAAACAIKILQDDLSKQNGTTVEALLDDLCYKDAISDDRELLLDYINMVANDIVWATSGSYFDKNDNTNEYYLRVEGGVNYEQRVTDYASQMDSNSKDEYYYTFLSEIFSLSNTYRSGFRIWERQIAWNSHKTMRNGYIFMGNPNEKDTTSPRQHFYIYFLPIFNSNHQGYGNDEDEVYFIMDELSDGVKQKIALYGASIALERSADNTQKTYYKQLVDKYYKELRRLFETEFMEKTKVEYCGNRCPMKSYQIEGALSKDMVIDKVASLVFEEHFNQENPNYPKFTFLQEFVAKENFDRFIMSAKQKIASPTESNRNGEAILSGLGLYKNGELSISDSIYARNIKSQLDAYGDRVINRDDILEKFYQEIYLSKDYKIESEYEFLVLATMAAVGELEIVLSDGRSVINAATIKEIVKLKHEDNYMFSHIRKPRGINYAVVKEISMRLCGNDLSNVLDRPETYEKLANMANEYSSRAVLMDNKVKSGYRFLGEFEIISNEDGKHKDIQLIGLSRMCDKLKSFNTEAKMRNLPWSVDDVKGILVGVDVLRELEDLFARLDDFKEEVEYLQQAIQYVTDKDLEDAMNQALVNFNKVIQSRDKNREEQSLNELQQVHQKYAKWYLDEYLKYHINELTNRTKLGLMNDERKMVCDQIKDADFLNTMQYDEWLKQMNRLQLASSSVTKEAVLARPYHNFNPKDFVGFQMKSIGELKAELGDIYDDYVQKFHSIMEDPGVKRNIDGLTEEERNTINQFMQGIIQLDSTYAIKLKLILDKLNRGFERIELDTRQILKIFSQPMSPEDAVNAFKQYIDKQLNGKNRGNARIIVK